MAALTACGGGGGDGGATAQSDGSLRVALTDAPSCGYDHVYVTVDRVRVHQSPTAGDADAGWREVVVSPARRIDLLALTNGVLEDLGSTPLPSGSYSQLRLVLADHSGSAPLANAVQPTGGAVTALSTPSAQQSGLKLQAHFDVLPGQLADLVLDFDACKSIVRAGNSGRYNLKPVVSVTPRLTTSIAGYVATTMTMSGTMVSAQQAGVVVRSTMPDANGYFALPFLPPGTYDVVVVSEGRSTAVVTSVPVAIGSASQTVISGTATAITPPTAAMREISGLLTAAPTPPATAAVLLTDATVRATQTLTSGPVIEVVKVNADAETGGYRVRLPVGAPVRATYSANLVLGFATDAPLYNKYRLQAAPTGRAAMEQALDLTTAGATLDFRFTP